MNELSTTKTGLLDVNEVAKYLGISPRALKDLCRAQKINFLKINHRNWRFRLADVEEYLQRVTFRRKSVYGSKHSQQPLTKDSSSYAHGPSSFVLVLLWRSQLVSLAVFLPTILALQTIKPWL